jgi:hypothetical protein
MSNTEKENVILNLSLELLLEAVRAHRLAAARQGVSDHAIVEVAL